MFLYSVFDKKAISFGPLFTAENDDVAKRSVAGSIGSDTLLAFAPGDFSLYCLGEYDTDTGSVSGFSPVNFVCEVLSLIKVDKDKESGMDSVSLQPRQA